MKKKEEEMLAEIKSSLQRAIAAAYDLEYELKDDIKSDDIGHAISKMVDANQLLQKLK